jgi:hypothetical protein
MKQTLHNPTLMFGGKQIEIKGAILRINSLDDFEPIIYKISPKMGKFFNALSNKIRYYANTNKLYASITSVQNVMMQAKIIFDEATTNKLITDEWDLKVCEYTLEIKFRIVEQETNEEICGHISLI